MENGQLPATKQDIEQLRAEMAEMKDRLVAIDGRITASEDRLIEAFRDSQTKLLKAFYNYSQTNDERVASTESEADSLKKRLAIIESRLKDVEIKLNMPQAA